MLRVVLVAPSEHLSRASVFTVQYSGAGYSVTVIQCCWVIAQVSYLQYEIRWNSNDQTKENNVLTLSFLFIYSSEHFNEWDRTSYIIDHQKWILLRGRNVKQIDD